MKNYVSIETSEGPIQIMLLSEADENIIKSFKAATVCLNWTYSDLEDVEHEEFYLEPGTPEHARREKRINKDHAQKQVVKMFIENYFMIGMAWDVDEDSMTDEERELWEQAGEAAMDRWEALESDDIENLIYEWEEANEQEMENIMAMSAFEQQLTTI